MPNQKTPSDVSKLIKDREDKLTSSREALKKLLSARQEAIAILDGLLR